VFLQEKRKHNQQSFKLSCCQVFSTWRKMSFLCNVPPERSAVEKHASYLFHLTRNFLYTLLLSPLLKEKQLNTLL